MITSTKNPTVQFIRKLQNRSRARREEAAFVIEGLRLVEDALESGEVPKTVLVRPNLNDRGQQLRAALAARGVPIVEVSEAVLAAASDTRTPQGMLAVMPAPGRAIPDHADLWLVLDGLRDPGNLGTILRTAAAAGVDAVLLPPGTADAYAPKVIRAAMGAHFRLPIQMVSWDELPGMLAGSELFLADAGGELPYTRANLRDPTALIIGGEAQGASEQILQLSPRRVSIPMPGGSESLNAAAAAAILIYEALRQRSQTQAGNR